MYLILESLEFRHWYINQATDVCSILCVIVTFISHLGHCRAAKLEYGVPSDTPSKMPPETFLIVYYVYIVQQIPFVKENTTRA